VQKIHERKRLIVPGENGKIAVSSLDICFHDYKILNKRPSYQVKYVMKKELILETFFLVNPQEVQRDFHNYKFLTKQSCIKKIHCKKGVGSQKKFTS
jgi:hypothetical protein